MEHTFRSVLPSAVAIRGSFGYSLPMSFTELKEQVVTLSRKQQLELSAFLKHLARRDDPQHHAELTRIMREMDNGVKFTMADVERLRTLRHSA